MLQALMIEHRDLLIASTAALSAFLSCVLVSWPYLVKDALGVRMRQLADDREVIRVRERAILHGDKQSSLRTEPKKVFKDIFDRLNLSGQAEDGEMVRKLRMAGYRGRGPVVTFIAVRVITPFLLLAVAALYIFVLVQLDYPFIVKLGIVIAAALLGYYAPAIYVQNRITKRQKSIRRAWPDAPSTFF